MPNLAQFHQQQINYGECTTHIHANCSGDCPTCNHRKLSAVDIERFDPFAFFVPDGEY